MDWKLWLLGGLFTISVSLGSWASNSLFENDQRHADELREHLQRIATQEENARHVGFALDRIEHRLERIEGKVDQLQ